MEEPFSDKLYELADSAGISLFQRFSLTEGSLFLRCPLEEVKKLVKTKKISFIQVTEKQVEFFGYQLLQHLLNSVSVISPFNPPQDRVDTDRIIRSQEVQELTGLSRTTLWRLERKGEFPARVPLCAGSVGWRLSDVEEWLRKL